MARTVVHLCRTFVPHVGGVERHVMQVSQELKKSNIQSVVICCSHDADLPEKEVMAGVTVHRLSASPTPPTDFWAGLKYKRALWNALSTHTQLLQNADAVQIHDVFWWILPFLQNIPKQKRYMTFHGYESLALPSTKQRWWHQLAAAQTAGNLCVGAFHQEVYGVTPTQTTFGAIDTEQVPAHDHTVQAKKLLFVGRLATDTSIMQYVQAVDLLVQQKKSVSLTVYGDGPLTQKLTALIEEKKLPIQLRGNIKNEAIPWQEYDLVLASQYLVILESLSKNLPVVAHANGPLKERYLQTAPYAQWIPICDTAQEIAAVLRNRVALPALAVEWAQKQTWKKLAQTYLSLWNLV